MSAALDTRRGGACRAVMGDSIILLILAGLLALAIAAALWLYRAWRRSRAEAVALTQANRRLEALLAAAPQSYAAWANDGASAVTPRLPPVLGLDQIKRIEEIETALQPSDSAALHGWAQYRRAARF